MKVFLKISLIIILFNCASFKSEAKGRDVVIFLKDSTVVKGELLSVRDSLLAVAIEPISADEDIAAYPERVKIVKISTMNTIIINENDIRFQSGFIGAGIGGATGFLLTQIYHTQDKYTPIFGSALIFFLVGWTVGNTLSDDEERFTFFTDNLKNYQVKAKKFGLIETLLLYDTLPLLTDHARFKESEPTYVRDIIDNLLKETK